jgi:hypothetical protein
MIDYRMVKRVKNVVMIGALAAALPALAPAAAIFTNFGPSLAYDITQGNPVGNDFGGDNAAEGDSFTPSASATFGSARLALSCVIGCPAAMNFTVSLDSDSSDSPGAAIESFSFTSAMLNVLGNNNTPITVTSLLHPTLSSGARYWITVSSSLTYAIAWNDNSTSDVSNQAVSSDGGATWFSPSGQTPGALEVDSVAAPEPSSAWLFGAGLILALLRKRSAIRKA